MIDIEKEKARIKKDMALLDIEIDNYKFQEYSSHLIKQIDIELCRLKNMKNELGKHNQLAPAQISKFISDLENELSNIHDFYGSVAVTYNRISGSRHELQKLYNAVFEQPASKNRRRKNS